MELVSRSHGESSSRIDDLREVAESNLHGNEETKLLVGDEVEAAESSVADDVLKRVGNAETVVRNEMANDETTDVAEGRIVYPRTVDNRATNDNSVDGSNGSLSEEGLGVALKDGKKKETGTKVLHLKTKFLVALKNLLLDLRLFFWYSFHLFTYRL